MRRRLVVGAIALTLVPAAPTSSTAADGIVPKPATKSPPSEVRFVDSSMDEIKALQAAARKIAAEAAAKSAASAAKLKARQLAAKKRAAAAAARRKAAAVARARASRAAARKALLTPSYVWAHDPFSVRVANCESGGGPSDHSPVYNGNAHLHDPNGHYGKWQFDFSTWREVGGSGNPADYSETTQDERAYRLWRANGWSRWECARMVG